MAKATEKSVGVENFLTQLMGTDRLKTIAANTCICCKGQAIDFNDSISRKEYTISGFCQKCQDKNFKIEMTND